MRKIKGFTLIEIVVVIVLIGILSAVALPRFYNFTGKATEAAAKGMSGALASSVSMAHSAYLAEGSQASAFGPATTYGFSVNSKGYPAPTTFSDAACATLLTKLLSESSNTSEYISYTDVTATQLSGQLTDIEPGKTCIYVHRGSSNNGSMTGEGGPFSYYAVSYNTVKGTVKQTTVDNVTITATPIAPTTGTGG